MIAFDDDTSCEVFVRHLNEVIEDAVHYGGDLGGPYYTDGEDLYRSMDGLARWIGLYSMGYVIAFAGDETPLFAKPITLEDVDGKKPQPE